MINKILVGVDFSDPSLNALDYAAELAAINGSELVILNIVPELTPLATTRHMRGDISKLQKGVEKERKSLLLEQAKRINEVHPKLKVKSMIKSGSASRAIIDASREEDIDLIVVGNRGKGGIVTWMLGSVSREIVESCTAPVLVVKDHKFCAL